jgi:hypothetical protein
MIRTVGRKILEGLGLYGLYSLKVKGPLLEDGWFRSFAEGRPVDRQGNPVPFITYPAWEFLRRRIRPEMRVFEYGSGASTLWWAVRVKEIFSAEYQPEWYARISKQAPRNATVYLQPLGDKEAYARLAKKPGKQFCIVVIDGRERVRCALHAVEALAPDGVIVWDNSDREKYEPGFRFLKERGFRRLEFVGLSPGVNERSETSIFYRPGNCLEI